MELVAGGRDGGGGGWDVSARSGNAVRSGLWATSMTLLPQLPLLLGILEEVAASLVTGLTSGAAVSDRWTHDLR